MLIKPSYNDEVRIFDYSPQLPDDETLASATVQIRRIDTGADCSAEMIADVAVYNQVEIRYRLFGGTAGITYQRMFRATTSSGRKVEDTAPLKCI